MMKIAKHFLSVHILEGMSENQIYHQILLVTTLDFTKK